MEPDHITKKSPWQFSVRSALLAIAVLAVCLTIILVQIRRVEQQGFVATSVRPIVENHVASVGYASQSTESGLSHLHGILTLRKAGLDIDSIDPELIRTLKWAIANCTILNNSKPSPAATYNADEP